jgi:hypothetical protein
VEVRDDATDALIGTSSQSSASPTIGSTAIRLPLQSAVVISIRTNTPGASGRGRLYWPATGQQLGTDAKTSTPSAASMATDAKTYLMGIRSALAAAFPTIGFDLAVRSKATHTTPHAVRLQVGNVIDTQRRRRDALIESYSSVLVP